MAESKIVKPKGERVYKRFTLVMNATLNKNAFQWYDVTYPEIAGYQAACVVDYSFSGSGKLNIQSLYVDRASGQIKVGVQNLDTNANVTFSLYATIIYESDLRYET